MSQHVTCIECGAPDCSIIDTRPTKVLGYRSTRRRKKCLKCDLRFTTYEIPDFLLDEFKMELKLTAVKEQLRKKLLKIKCKRRKPHE